MPPHRETVETLGRMVTTEQARMLSIDLSVLQRFGDRLQADRVNVKELKPSSGYSERVLWWYVRVIVGDTRTWMTHH